MRIQKRIPLKGNKFLFSKDQVLIGNNIYLSRHLCLKHESGQNELQQFNLKSIDNDVNSDRLVIKHFGDTLNVVAPEFGQREYMDQFMYLPTQYVLEVFRYLKGYCYEIYNLENQLVKSVQVEVSFFNQSDSNWISCFKARDGKFYIMNENGNIRKINYRYLKNTVINRFWVVDEKVIL